MSMNAPAIRGVLFDLDNTLVHRDRSIAHYAQRLADDYALRMAPTLSDTIATLIVERDGGGYGVSGSTFPTVRDDVTSALLTRLPWHDAPPADELIAHWFAHFPGSSVEMPGATALLEALAAAGIALAIVSNGLDASRQKLARAMGFDRHVRFVLSSEAAGVKKPDARIFEQATAALGVEPRECLFVGDHPVNDAAGAHAAGLCAVWLRGFHEWPADAAPLPTIADLQHVHDHLAR